MDYFKYDVVYAMNITDVDDKVNTVQYGGQWLSGRVLVSRSKGCRFEPNWRHCIVSLSKTH